MKITDTVTCNSSAYLPYGIEGSGFRDLTFQVTVCVLNKTVISISI